MPDTRLGAKNSSVDYRGRDRAIGRMIGAYQIGVMEALAQTIGQGKPLGHVARRLADEGLVQLFQRQLPGGVTYCQLSEKGALRIGLPVERAKPLQGQALDKAIAVLCYCTLSDARRYRVERSDLVKIFPKASFPTNQVHCVSDENGRVIVQRLHLVQGSAEPVVKALREEMASAKGELREAIEAKQYLFVLLVDSVAKLQSLDRAIERSELRDSGEVRVVPSATAKTVAACLRGLRKKPGP